jgi:hypothetical protein
MLGQPAGITSDRVGRRRRRKNPMTPKRRGMMIPRPPKLDEMNHLQWAGFLVGNVVMAVVGTVVALIVVTIIVGLADGH